LPPARDDDGMPFLGLLFFYTVFVLLAERVALKAWRRARERGPGTPLLQVPRLRDVRWGVALVPVTVLALWAFGTFGITSGNLFETSTLTGSVWLSLLTVAIVAGYTLYQPRRAGYLAAIGLTALGAWVLFEALVFAHYIYDYEWFGWLRDQLRFPELALLGMACLAGGFFLTRRTIVADVRARRGGLTARVERLTQTRAEAVDSAAAELRRLERDLHDGAQARLVALGINLRTAEKMMEASPAAAAALVADCRNTATLALAELRGLVRGIYPPVLADRGVGDAIKALALDCPVLTLTDIQLDGRPPAPVESAVYFAVAEVLSNAVKHAEARAILIRVTHASGMLRAEIDDDGIGGADSSGGTGLAGIERRLAAFDGILAISSPIGGPTIVVIEVPCALSSPKTSTS
jgi:signal transduction histidine kinase